MKESGPLFFAGKGKGRRGEGERLCRVEQKGGGMKLSLVSGDRGEEKKKGEEEKDSSHPAPAGRKRWWVSQPTSSRRGKGKEGEGEKKHAYVPEKKTISHLVPKKKKRKRGPCND